MKKILETLNEAELRIILNSLCDNDLELAKKAETLAKKNLCNIDVEAISNDVFSSLDALDGDDLFHASGSQVGGGYEEPGEVAHKMVGCVLEEFTNRLGEYSKLGLHDEAMYYCMAILKGLKKYSNEGSSVFKDWACDSYDTYFDDILKSWEENCENDCHIAKMNEYVDNL